MESSDSVSIRMFCPRCGHKIVAYKGCDGSLRIQCDKCKAVIFSKRHTKRELSFKLVEAAN